MYSLDENEEKDTKVEIQKIDKKKEKRIRGKAEGNQTEKQNQSY